MVSDVNMHHERMSNFVSFLLLGFTLVIKLIIFYFKSHSNTLIIFPKNLYVVRFEYVP